MSGAIRIVFLIGDLIFLNLAVLASITLHDSAWRANVQYTYLLVFSNVAWLFLVMVSTPYNVSRSWSLSKIVKSQFAFVFIHLLIVASLVFFFKQRYPVLLIGGIYLLFIPTFFFLRVVTFYVRKLVVDELDIRNFVLLGRNEKAAELRRFYLTHPELGFRFKGYLEFDSSESSIARVRQFCSDQNVQEIYCCIEDISENDLSALINFGLDSLIKVRMITNPASAQSIVLDRLDQTPAIGSAIVLDETRYQFVKRVFDIFFSAAFCVFIASWLFPLIAILIKFDSKGPVFFVQARSGRGNRPFNCLKFRTMVVNQQADSIQATKGDSRITKLGHFLRSSSIDELPQFLNVLGGTMSVVGPRPHMLRHTEEYSKLIEKFMGRHYIKPGITGLAQCLGYRGETKDVVDMENRVRMDRYYIENWTFWLDIKIVFLTVVSLVRGSDKAF